MQQNDKQKWNENGKEMREPSRYNAACNDGSEKT
jgi:hypothetical protein